ncbi:Fic family protein [Pseudomaricurvus sp.]|uniref:Fic family protein n=1 Tax=Pseudomaricurvus sp. TaxID=2004510 RepID=UPI003F6AF664
MPILPSIEPLIPSAAGIDESNLPEKALDLERKAARLSGMISTQTAEVLEEHLRVINSYYSNLIEGHNTHPRDIRKAMKGDYSLDPVKRDLQLESIAHVTVQNTLATEAYGAVDLVGADCFKHIHKLFYERLPETLRQVKSANEKTWAYVEPGVFRQNGQDVEIGSHLPPAPNELDRYLERFQEVFRLDRLHGQKKVIGAMAAHHRFTWIHPFIDGNGRVGRLHTDLFLRSIGIGATGIWCLSRGLARRHADYKSALAEADKGRQGVSDGRGALSENGLIQFCEFMIDTAIDQVDFMTKVLDLENMVKRIGSYIEDRNRGLIVGMPPIKPEAARLLEKAYLHGEFERSEMEKITGLGLSVTRKIVQQLKEEGLLTETSSRSPLRWAIPEHAERYYLPELSPA